MNNKQHRKTLKKLKKILHNCSFFKYNLNIIKLVNFKEYKSFI